MEQEELENIINNIWSNELPASSKDAEKIKKENEKKTKDILKAQKELEKESKKEAENLQKEILQKQILDDTENIKKKEEQKIYKNIENTDIKFVLDKFFEKFQKNTDEIRNNPDTQAMSIYDVYRYFDRFFEIKNRIDRKWIEIEELIWKLENIKDYKDYEALEFALVYYVIRLADEQKRYLKTKRHLEIEEKRLFDVYRPQLPTDTAARNTVDNILLPISEDVAKMKQDQEARKMKLEWYIRLAEFIKSDNIKELADAKRIDSLQNTNPHYQ